MYIDQEMKKYLNKILLEVPLKEILEEIPYETIEVEGKTYMRISKSGKMMRYIDPYTSERKENYFDKFYICLDEPICYDETDIINRKNIYKNLIILLHVYVKINEKMAINVYGENWDYINGYPPDNIRIIDGFGNLLRESIERKYPELFV